MEPEYLLLRGRLSRDDDFTPRRCESTTFIRDRPDPVQPDHGDVVAETLDDEGRVVRVERPTLVPESVCAPSPRTWRLLVYIALDEGAATLRLCRGNRILWSTPIPDRPEVNVKLVSLPKRGAPDGKTSRRPRQSDSPPDFPGGKPAVISIDFSRPVDPALAFIKVIYRWSERGFHAVHIGLASKRITIDSDRLPGGDRCEFFVAYSNGFRTALARTNAFELMPIGPVLNIVEPSSGRSFTEGMPISLQGGVIDPEYPAAPSDDSSIRWLLNDEMVATGMIGSIDPLPIGDYRITMEHTRRGSEPVRAERLVHVKRAELPPAEAWPPVDIFNL